jgi:hypothetical protein
MTPAPDIDPRDRPVDPAGTQPRHDPATLLPAHREADAVDSSAVEDGGDLLPERLAASAPGAPRATPGHSEHAHRFQFLTGALLAVAIAAVAGVALLVFGTPGGKKDGPVWSPWKPTAKGVAGAQQVAGHVGAEYRDGGAQLFNVDTNGLSYKGTPLTVALRQAPAQGGDIQIHGDSGVLYEMCGLGPGCSLSSGKPSLERAFLLRRAGLELALYSLRYLGVKQVVVVLPPPPGRIQTVALYYRKGDVASELDRPLTASLTPRPPAVRAVAAAPDAGLVREVTKTNYLFSLVGSGFNEGAFLVLDPYTKAADAKLQKQLAKQAKAAAASASSSASGG